jgi:hypothetical protein
MLTLIQGVIKIPFLNYLFFENSSFHCFFESLGIQGYKEGPIQVSNCHEIGKYFIPYFSLEIPFIPISKLNLITTFEPSNGIGGSEAKCLQRHG